MLVKHQQKKRSLSRSRSKGYIKQKTEVEKKMEKEKFKTDKLWHGRAGEADRWIGSKIPHHLNSGK